MENQKKNFTVDTTIFNRLAQALSSQSLLDVFVIQGLILPADAEKIKTKYKNNLAVERFLLSNKLISREAINKAYSIILKLPFISLGNLQIAKEAAETVPEKTARRFLIAPFALKDNVVSLAIGSPGELLLVGNQNLERVFLNKEIVLELFVSTPEDVLQALNQRQTQSGALLSKGAYPVIFLRNRDIEAKYLTLLPLNFIEENRIAIFDQNSERSFRIVEEDPYSAKTRQIINYLKKNNNLEFEEFATSKDDLDYIINIYQQKTGIGEKNLTQSSSEKQPAATPAKKSGGVFESLLKDEQEGFTVESKEKSATADDSAGKTIDSDLVVEDIPINRERNTKVRSEIDERQKSEEAQKDIGKLLGEDITSIDQLTKIISEKSVPKLVAAIISYALSLGASDIHIEPEAKKIRVRFRIDGVLKDIFNLPIESEAQVTSRIKILGVMKLDETRIPQDGRFSVNFKNRAVDVRVSMLPTVYGEKTVMRILDKTAGILSLEDLGFVGSAFRIIMEEIKKPYGIIMATGPTGSGKSTTLYAILNRINQPGVNVVTIEDPVEYDIPGVNQCQIKPKIGFTFAEGLRSILRQDPNIIMVGEVRDADTANMATHAALTGHLVLTTLHTNDAASALPRLINMGIEPFLITSSVNLIIAQRLVRRICVKCREKVDTPPALQSAVKAELEKIPKIDSDDLLRVKKEIQFFRGKGCSECNDGFRGRIGIYELLVMNEKIEDLAVSRRPASEIKQEAIKNGMLTIRQDGILKALDGLTTIDEVLMATGEIETEVLAMGSNNISSQKESKNTQPISNTISENPPSTETNQV